MCLMLANMIIALLFDAILLKTDCACQPFGFLSPQRYRVHRV
jgi:hypothetical protein